MKTLKMLFGITVFSMAVVFYSCEESANSVVEDQEVSVEILNQLQELGFSTHNVKKEDGGYVVEGDIFMSEDDIWALSEGSALRTAAEEQYRTTNIVTGLPRVITVSVDSKLPSNFGPALDECIDRYNNLNLDIAFQRITAGGKGKNKIVADISIVAGPRKWNRPDHWGYITLGQGGFPSGGDPYEEVKMNGEYFSTKAVNYVALVLAHEIGHNIGFRHTDFMDRSFSCGGGYANEGQAGVGAIHIPGTSVDAEYGSWMLSCADGGDRPFTNNDKAALDYLY
ncbi:M57 family metalloprotease [Bacteroidota bacterium]